MKEDKSKVIPMMVKDSDDPYIYNTNTGEFQEFYPVVTNLRQQYEEALASEKSIRDSE